MKLNFTPEEIESLRISFLQLIPSTDALAESFYEQMFRENPEVRAYFKEDMQSQQDKLIDTLALLLDILNESAVAEKALMDLGKRHVAYGATPKLYDWVEHAILEKLVEKVSSDEKEQITGLWTRLMSTVTDTMLEGASLASKSTSPDVE